MLPEPQEPECLPPQQIINGVCQFLQPTTFRPSIRPFFTTSTTPAPPPTSTIPPPIGLPRPSYPKKIEPLPTLPPKIAEKTFINPPLITNTFSVSQFLVHDLKWIPRRYSICLDTGQFWIFQFWPSKFEKSNFQNWMRWKKLSSFFPGSFRLLRQLGRLLTLFRLFRRCQYWRKAQNIRF